MAFGKGLSRSHYPFEGCLQFDYVRSKTRIRRMVLEDLECPDLTLFRVWKYPEVNFSTFSRLATFYRNRWFDACQAYRFETGSES